MVDVVVASSYGYHLGAVSKWAVNVEDPLSTAINDFPKRGILVRLSCHILFLSHSVFDSGVMISAKCGADLGMEPCLSYPEPTMETDV
jgi:hypothetical protein